MCMCNGAFVFLYVMCGVHECDLYLCTKACENILGPDFHFHFHFHFHFI